MLARYTAGEWNRGDSFDHQQSSRFATRSRAFWHSVSPLSITKETKEEQERKEMELLAQNNVYHLIVLARYMQVISNR